jgi:hypothetical protein
LLLVAHLAGHADAERLLLVVLLEGLLLRHEAALTLKALL